MRYEPHGYEDSEIHIKRGDRVRVPAGVLVLYRGEVLVTKRAQTVTVDHVLPGRTVARHLYREEEAGSDYGPSVRWAGSGGYWKAADINDVEKLEE